jgi:amino acid transporter
MRPTFGYAMIFCMVLMFITATGVMLFSSVEKAIQVIIAYSSMQWIIVAGLAALGVYIKKRSDDKAGGGALGLVGSLMRKIGK